jgi:hypothetical protein
VSQVDPTLRPGGDPEDAALATILEVVRGRTGTDFAGYRCFRPEVQAHVERVLLQGLASGGLLWLEEAEWPSAAARALDPVDEQARLFRAVGEAGAA